MTIPTTTETALDIEALSRAIAASDFDAVGALLTDDVEWIEVDERTRPATPAVLRGRDAVVGTLREAHAREIVTVVDDAFAAGDRAALRLVCRYASGGEVVCNALVDVRDGRIARFSGVQAWDE
jgi:ketosteroid isomerase-like protein